MKQLFKLSLITSFSLILTACSNPKPIPQAGTSALGNHHTPVAYKQSVISSQTSSTTNQRINTTACSDSDDWYLDGYRVGKSFSNQKNTMISQRANYCGYSTNSLPSTFRSNWEKGYQIGISARL